MDRRTAHTRVGVRPILRTVTDRANGETTEVPIPCGVYPIKRLPDMR